VFGEFGEVEVSAGDLALVDMRPLRKRRRRTAGMTTDEVTVSSLSVHVRWRATGVEALSSVLTTTTGN